MDTFEERMKQKTDDEIIKIVTIASEDYQPEALEAARHEFSKRNLSAEQIDNVKKIVNEEQEEDIYKADLPLDPTIKFLTFILPALIQFIYSGIYISEGYHRKAKELTKWTLYGFAFYVTIIVLAWIFS